MASASHMVVIDKQTKLRSDECAKVRKMCQDYELSSSNLDKSVLEILYKVQDTLDKDTNFLEKEQKRLVEDVKTVSVKLEEMKKKLDQQTLDGY